nr:DUF305 domain-containing protein [Cytophaga sp. FL35]
MELSRYTKFFLMLLCSGLSMYLTMYFNTYELDHVFFSITRLYMTLIGMAGMALIMFLFMKSMYTSKRKNRMIVGLSLMTMGVCTFLVRTQKPIGDIGWMKAMIPHHSIAILTSERAAIKDPEVKELSNEIIKAQKKEIAQMKKMIERLESN